MTTREEFLHAPERGWAHKLLGPLHVTGVFWYKFHRFGVRILPDRAVGPVIFLFTSFFFVALIKIRRAVAANLEPVLGHAGFWTRQRRIWRTLHSFAWCLSERFERLVTDREFEIDADHQEHWREITSTGEGFVMVTAHVGNYEVGSMLPASEEQRRVHLVREPEANPKAQAFVQSLLDGHDGAGHYSWHFQSVNPMHALPLVHGLQRGEIVAMQGDRPRTGTRSVTAELFGHPLELPAGPVTLARLAEVRILPVFVFRVGRRRYRTVFRPPIDVPRTDDRRADLEQGTKEIARHIEWAIRHRPHQWFCFRNLWGG